MSSLITRACSPRVGDHIANDNGTSSVVTAVNGDVISYRFQWCGDAGEDADDPVEGTMTLALYCELISKAIEGGHRFTPAKRRPALPEPHQMGYITREEQRFTLNIRRGRVFR